MYVANLSTAEWTVKDDGFHNLKIIRRFRHNISSWTSLIRRQPVRLRKISQTPRFPARMSGETGRRPAAPASESEDERASRAFGKYGGIGLQFALSILLFLYAGQWVDRRFHSSPWGVLAGVLVGGSAGFYSMYRRLMADLERGERARRAARDASSERDEGGRTS